MNLKQPLALLQALSVAISDLLEHRREQPCVAGHEPGAAGSVQKRWEGRVLRFPFLLSCSCESRRVIVKRFSIWMTSYGQVAPTPLDDSRW
jgi:hypothetical protein